MPGTYTQQILAIVVTAIIVVVIIIIITIITIGILVLPHKTVKGIK